jgi:hypothetical protein
VDAVVPNEVTAGYLGCHDFRAVLVEVDAVVSSVLGLSDFWNQEMRTTKCGQIDCCEKGISLSVVVVVAVTSIESLFFEKRRKIVSFVSGNADVVFVPPLHFHRVAMLVNVPPGRPDVVVFSSLDDGDGSKGCAKASFGVVFDRLDAVAVGPVVVVVEWAAPLLLVLAAAAVVVVVEVAVALVGGHVEKDDDDDGYWKQVFDDHLGHDDPDKFFPPLVVISYRYWDDPLRETP